MKHSIFTDPFLLARQNNTIHIVEDQNDSAQLVLGLKDVRKCAHNWQTFQSAATPGRIVVPSEVNIRTTRQIPFELDPPEHKSYRDLIEPWFKRPLEADYQAKLAGLVKQAFGGIDNEQTIDVVSNFALPLQSRALTLLLNTDISEADTWIDWGTHVFRSEHSALDAQKADILYDYIDAQIDQRLQSTSAEFHGDLYAVLLNSHINGRLMTKEEVKGVMILTFAGGRDTVINMLTNSMAYFAEHPLALSALKDDEQAIARAVEELVG